MREQYFMMMILKLRLVQVRNLIVVAVESAGIGGKLNLGQLLKMDQALATYHN